MLSPHQWENYRIVIARLEARERALEAGIRGQLPPSRGWVDDDTQDAVEATCLS